MNESVIARGNHRRPFSQIMDGHSYNLLADVMSSDRKENPAASLDIISRQDTEKGSIGPIC